MDHFYNDVNDWLLVGGDLDIAQAVTGDTHSDIMRHLADERGVTHVLDCRREWDDKAAWINAGWIFPANYCHAPIVDSGSHRPDESWYVSVENFVRRFLDERGSGDRIYVHCHMGINRGPSAAMLALLTADPSMDPWDAFMTIRGARSVSGVVYAEHVGSRHIKNKSDNQAAFTYDSRTYGEVCDFRASLHAYWTPEMRQNMHKGISFYRDAEGETLVVEA